ncbi:MAG: G8 domain-containing protein [Planctomycetales bacterium]|nr:G8 domain-containing protein [Planctomycetales bacterium]
MDYLHFPLPIFAQIPLLTENQIASIPSRPVFALLTSAQREALTVGQIRSLNVARVGLALLNPTQRTLVTTDQVKSLGSIDFALLTPSQVTLLTPQQFAAAENVGHIRGLSNEAQDQLSSAQVLSLPLDIYEQFVGGFFDAEKLAKFTPAKDYGVAEDGLTNNPHAINAWNQVLSLVPSDQATHVALASGDWSNPQIWSGGQIPTAGARVFIPQGLQLTLSSVLTTALDTVRIDGSLSFNPNVDTQLIADTIVVNTSGALHVGSETTPVAQNRTARVVFTTGDPIDTTWDPNLLSRGLISRGEVRLYGAETTSFVGLSVPVQAGDTKLTLAEVPANWQVGDRLMLTGSRFWQDDFGAEEVTIRAISGTTIIVDPLQYEHAPPAGYGLQTHVANMERNVRIIADDVNAPAERRPHVMFMQNPNVEVVNVGVYGLGRTNKLEPLNAPVVVDGVLQPGTGTNPPARYPIHFHHTGVDPDSTPGLVRGVVVDGSPGWGFVIHQSYAIVEDSVAFNATGAAFTGEDGNEIGAFLRNLAISTHGSVEDPRSRTDIGDFGFSGHGFWLQGPTIEMEGNISAGSDDSGFAIFTSSAKAAYAAEDVGPAGWAGEARIVPVGAVPVATFANNTAYAARQGLEVWFLTGGWRDLAPSVITNFTYWGSRLSAIFVHYSKNVVIDGGLLIGTGQPDVPGIGVNYRTRDMTFKSVTIHDFSEGIIVPHNGKSIIENGDFRTLSAIIVLAAFTPNRSVEIVGNPTFASPAGAWATGLPRYLVELDGTSSFIHQTEYAIVSSDRITMNTSSTGLVQLFYPQQDANYIPFPAADAGGYVRDEWLNLTNAQLWQDFGVALAGQVTPANAVTQPGIKGSVFDLG